MYINNRLIYWMLCANESNKEGLWIPIFDNCNDWIQLSRANACIKYLSEYHNPPEWGIKGDEDVDMVSHIMCSVSVATHGEIETGLESV